MELGLFNLMGVYDRNWSSREVVDTTVQMVKLAEGLSFKTAWFAEHHFTNHSVCPSPLMMVARCAAETRKIQLGPAVMVLPFHNPLKLTEELMFADVLTDGRLVIGVGPGYQVQEFDRLGVAMDTRHQVAGEALDIIEMAFRYGRVEYEGEHFQVPSTDISINRVQAPMPDVFVASMHPALLGRAAQRDHTTFLSVGHRGVTGILEAKRVVDRAYAMAHPDRRTQGTSLAIQRYIYVTEDAQEAALAAQCIRDLARAAAALVSTQSGLGETYLTLMPFKDEPPLDDFLENAIIGGVEDCAEKLAAEIELLRPAHLSCFMGFAGISARNTLRSLERFGTRVVPLLQKASSTSRRPKPQATLRLVASN